MRKWKVPYFPMIDSHNKSENTKKQVSFNVKTGECRSLDLHSSDYLQKPQTLFAIDYSPQHLHIFCSKIRNILIFLWLEISWKTIGFKNCVAIDNKIYAKGAV